MKLHVLDEARKDHIHVQVGMVRNPLWQLFFYFLFFNYQKCAGHYWKLEQAHDSELHCLSVTDGLVCVYMRDSEPVFLSICKQSACSQNSCLNLTQVCVRNKCFVSRNVFVITSLTLHFLKWMETLSSLMCRNEGLNIVLQSSVNSLDTVTHIRYVYIACRGKWQVIPESVWVPLGCAQACSVNLP